MIDVLASPRFGAGEAGTAWLGAGWAAPEPGFVWSVGTESAIALPRPAGGGALALEIVGAPFRAPPAVRYQRIRVVVNGVVVADRRLGGEIVWWIDLPAEACLGEMLHIRLVRGGDAVRADVPLADQRDLGFRLEALTLLRIRGEPPPPPLRAVTTIRFGVNEMTEGWLGEGFGAPEDGYVWALGRTSEMTVPVDAAGGRMLVLLDMRPARNAGDQPRQRVAISVDGRFGSFFDLRSWQTIAIEVSSAVGQKVLALRFDHPDADPAGACAADGRPFAWALASVRITAAPPAITPATLAPHHAECSDADSLARALTGLEAAALLASFEAIGNFCDLGKLQKDHGDKQPSLLRWAGILQHDLVDGLASDFAQVGRPDLIKWRQHHPRDTTWRLVSRAFGLSLPTNDELEAPRTFRTTLGAARILAWLAREMLPASGHQRIFVLRTLEDICAVPAALAVLAMLRRRSDAPLLMLVADKAGKPGEVSRLPNGIVVGQLGPQIEGVPVAKLLLIGVLARAWSLLRMPVDGAMARQVIGSST